MLFVRIMSCSICSLSKVSHRGKFFSHASMIDCDLQLHQHRVLHCVCLKFMVRRSQVLTSAEPPPPEFGWLRHETVANILPYRWFINDTCGRVLDTRLWKFLSTRNSWNRLIEVKFILKQMKQLWRVRLVPQRDACMVLSKWPYRQKSLDRSHRVSCNIDELLTACQRSTRVPWTLVWAGAF